MNQARNHRYKNSLEPAFSRCAEFITCSARNQIAASLEILSSAPNPPLPEAQLSRLRTFKFSQENFASAQKAIAVDFAERAMGFDLLFEKAYRILARAALKGIVAPYSVKSGIPPEEFFAIYYQPLMEAMEIPYYVVIEADPNIRKFLPRSPVRSGAVISPTRRSRCTATTLP